MSRSPLLSSSSPPRTAPLRNSAQNRRPARRLGWGFLILVLGSIAVFEPHSFRFCVSQLIRLEAWRNGVSAQIGAIDGSMFEPLVLRKTVWLYESGTGPITRLEIASATAEFSWRNLLPRSSGRWFQRLTLGGLSGKIQFPLEVTEPPAAGPTSSISLPTFSGRWMPAPERIEASEVNLIFQSNTDFVRLVDTDFTLSHIEAGTFRAGQIAIQQPWLSRTFRDARGTTAIQDAKVEVANLQLEPGVQLRSFSAELDKLARGQLNLSLRLDAFGGKIGVDARTLSAERPFYFESTVNFSEMNIAALANFLRLSDAAGGTIKQGTFKFRGPPQQFSKATASLRLEATNFQWESRQWDALVLGATLMDGRVQIPELALAQGHNRLNLNGELALPSPGVPWWKSEFSVNIAAKIDNLTELSALMLPEFKFAAGKANIDGSIRGKDQQFNGQLIVSGSDLNWRNAPIEHLHAGVRLNGNEFQITNVSLFSNGDYLRGRGVVNIIGDKQYWGEIRASIEDLAKYAALLERPIVPEPLAGGGIIDWSGEGSARGHSGKFSARLHKLRTLGATAALLHPIDADFEGVYAPGMMDFSRFRLSDDESSFSANVRVGDKALSLQNIRLYHRQALGLEGDAMLPLDVWKAWPNTSLATLLNDETVSKINLTTYNLELGPASRLSGWKFPIEGVVLGNLVAEGPLNALRTSGKVVLSKGRIPLGISGTSLTGVEAETVFEGSTWTIEKMIGRHASGDFTISGKVSLTEPRDPGLQLAFQTQRSEIALFDTAVPAATVMIAAQTEITGPLSGATISGEAKIFALSLPEWDGAAFFPKPRGLRLPAWSSVQSAPWNAWKWNIAIVTPEAVPLRIRAISNGTISANLRMSGVGSQPVLTGDVSFRDLTLNTGSSELNLEEAALTFRDGFDSDPALIARARGAAFGEPFAVNVTGSLRYPIRVFEFASPLTEQLLRLHWERPAGAKSPPQPLGLRVDAELFPATQISDWPLIETPMPPPKLAPDIAPADGQ